MKNKCLIPIPDDKILDWSKLKQTADNFSFSHNVFHSYISLVRQNVVLCGNRLKGRKHCEKRRNCLLQAISPFLMMFSIVW